MIAPMNAPTPTVYGITNCDTVKKARAWLAQHGVSYTFHDFKKLGLPEEALAHWLDSVGWEPLLNRRGTTWRRLDAATQAGVHDGASAAAVMRAQPSVIKRPVVDWGDAVTIGFDAQDWAQRIGQDS